MKYSLPECERRWRVEPRTLPGELGPASLIEDLYLDDSRLRLRRITDAGAVVHKLCKKYAPDPADMGGDPRTANRYITNIYLDEREYALLARLPGHALRKRRHRLAHAGQVFTLDVFEGTLAGLLLTEVDEPDAARRVAIRPPPWAGPEVTSDPRFEGASLARAPQAAWS